MVEQPPPTTTTTNQRTITNYFTSLPNCETTSDTSPNTSSTSYHRVSFTSPPTIGDTRPQAHHISPPQPAAAAVCGITSALSRPSPPAHRRTSSGAMLRQLTLNSCARFAGSFVPGASEASWVG